MDNEELCEVLQELGMTFSQAIGIVEETRPKFLVPEPDWAVVELCDPTNYDSDVDYEEDITI